MILPHEAVGRAEAALDRAEQAGKLLECYMQHEADQHTTTELIDTVLYTARNILEEIKTAKQSLSEC